MKISKDFVENNVPAANQLQGDDRIAFTWKQDADLKILFLGNSITCHGVAEDIGWSGDWGMAASKRENDYVHRLIEKIESGGKKVSYCVANVSEWERGCDLGLLKEDYAAVYAFEADLVVVRLGENATFPEQTERFERAYLELVESFARRGARILVSDLFWEYQPFDCFVEELAREKGYAFARLHDLGAAAEMKALGKFAHRGVAIHPGDRGMEKIAERIYEAIRRWVEK